MSKQNSSGSTWTPHQNKLFEKALALYDKETPERWQNITKAVGAGKSIEDVKRHYHLLLEDLRNIESGLIPIPNYNSNPTTSTNLDEEQRFFFLTLTLIFFFSIVIYMGTT